MKRRRRLLTVLIACTAAMVAGACSDTTPEADTRAEPASEQGIPDFSGTTFGGATFTDEDVEFPAAIKFFASWCPQCQSEARDFGSVMRDHPQLNLVLVAVDDSEAGAREFIERYGWREDAPLIDDTGRQIEGEFGLTGQPNTVFVNSAGNVVGTVRGVGQRSQLAELAERAAAGADAGEDARRAAAGS